MPHLQLNQDAVVKDYADSVRQSGELVQKLSQSQRIYADSAQSLEVATRKLAGQVEAAANRPADNSSQEIVALLKQVKEQQEKASREYAATMHQMVALLERGFRIRSDEKE